MVRKVEQPLNWAGHEALKPFLVALDEVKEDRHQLRTHPKANLDAIRESLTRFGQQTPLQVFVRDGQAEVIVGNGRVEVMREMGWTHVAIIPFEGSDEDAQAYAIADNRTAELATWDYQKWRETAGRFIDMKLTVPGFDASTMRILANRWKAAEGHDSGRGSEKTMTTIRVIGPRDRIDTIRKAVMVAVAEIEGVEVRG